MTTEIITSDIWTATTLSTTNYIRLANLGDTVYYNTVDPNVAVTSITHNQDGTATVVTTTDHGYTTGDNITIRGASQDWANGDKIITVINTTTFDFNTETQFVDPTAITGTIIASDNNNYAIPKPYLTAFAGDLWLRSDNNAVLIADTTVLFSAAGGGAASTAGRVFGRMQSIGTDTEPSGATTTYQAMVFATVAQADGVDADNTTGKFTILSSGTYKCKIFFGNHDFDGDWTFAIYKNGTIAQTPITAQITGGSSGDTFYGEIEEIDCIAGDEVQLYYKATQNDAVDWQNREGVSLYLEIEQVAGTPTTQIINKSDDILLDWSARIDGDPTLQGATLIGDAVWVPNDSGLAYVRLTNDTPTQNGWLYFDLGVGGITAPFSFYFCSDCFGGGGTDATQGDGFAIYIGTDSAPTTGDLGDSWSVNAPGVYYDNYNGGLAGPDTIKLRYSGTDVLTRTTNFSFFNSNRAPRVHSGFFDGNTWGAFIRSQNTDYGCAAYVLDSGQQLSGNARYIAINYRCGSAYGESRLYNVSVRKSIIV